MFIKLEGSFYYFFIKYALVFAVRRKKTLKLTENCISQIFCFYFCMAFFTRFERNFIYNQEIKLKLLP